MTKPTAQLVKCPPDAGGGWARYHMAATLTSFGPAVPLEPRYPVLTCGGLGAPRPSAGVIVWATAYAPAGRPATSLRVSVAVGKHRCSLLVLGDRRWLPGSGHSMGLSKPQPFTELPLGWERAFGGPGFPYNPIGKGYGAALSNDPERLALPNIEDPDNLIRSPQDTPLPVGFDRVEPTWEPRLSQLGTYDEQWLAARWPHLPEDFDPRFYNDALQALQMPYLTGDETLFFKHLHREHAELESRLPGIRLRCFRLSRGKQGEHFAELPAFLDTVAIDLSDESLELSWASPLGDAQPDSESFLYLVEEQVGQTPVPVFKHEQAMRAAMQERESPPELQVEQEPGSESESEEQKQAKKELDDLAAKLLADACEGLKKAGAAPGVVAELAAEKEPQAFLDKMMAAYPPDPELIEKHRQQQAEALKKALQERGEDTSMVDYLFGKEVESELKLTREQVLERHQSGEGLDEEDLTGLDLSGLDLSGGSFKGAIFTDANLAGTVFTGTDLTQANLVRAKMAQAVLDCALLAGADLSEANLEEADLSRADCTGAVLRKACLRRARLYELKGTMATFDEADMNRAYLESADLRRASLARAQLHDAKARRCDLSEAHLEGLRAECLDLTGAKIDRLRASGKAVLTGARFDRTEGERPIFQNADLRRATFTEAKLAGADLSGAQLDGAGLEGADLRESVLERACLEAARCAGVNLMGSRLTRADLSGADMTGANLYGAELLYSHRAGTCFDRALLGGTKLAPDAPRLPPEV